MGSTTHVGGENPIDVVRSTLYIYIYIYNILYIIHNLHCIYINRATYVSYVYKHLWHHTYTHFVIRSACSGTQ